jgi:DnaJ domain
MDGRRARALLGVDIDAGPDEIRRAFRVQALINHPDRGGDRVEFELIVLAFETLQHINVSHRLPIRPALPGARPRIDVYDSPRRIRPQRCFDDALRAAMGTTTL